MKLVTSELMRQVDKRAIEIEKIPSDELMENAGKGIAQAIIADIVLDMDKAGFAVFCGKGNNGGDGYVIGRYLYNAGYDVIFYSIGPPDKLSADARLNFDLIQKLPIETKEINKIEDLPEILETDYIVDALFGTGFEGSPKGISAEIIRYINSQPQEIIAVDMPSGLNSDTGAIEGEVVSADYTYTLALPKYGLYVTPGREISGEISIIPIGIPDKVIDSFKIYNHLITKEYVSRTLPQRPPDGHKGTFGKLFVLAGSTGLSGAAVLAGKSAYRSGCGTVKIGCPKTVLPLIAPAIIDATTVPLPDVGKKGALALRGLGEVKKLTAEHDAVVIGPGIGTHHETKELICRLLLSLDTPAIVDADGLNALVGNLQILEDTQADLILTPHPGEFEKLTGIKPDDDIHKRIQSARGFAIEYQTILCLKGSPTVVAHYDGKVYVNQTGNNGMAVGGSGDVLSGIIGSFLAQGMAPLDAALCGVFVHGLAGDIGSYDLGEHSLMASDMIEYLPDAFQMS